MNNVEFKIKDNGIGMYKNENLIKNESYVK